MTTELMPRDSFPTRFTELEQRAVWYARWLADKYGIDLSESNEYDLETEYRYYRAASGQVKWGRWRVRAVTFVNNPDAGRRWYSPHYTPEPVEPIVTILIPHWDHVQAVKHWHYDDNANAVPVYHLDARKAAREAKEHTAQSYAIAAG